MSKQDKTLANNKTEDADQPARRSFIGAAGKLAVTGALAASARPSAPPIPA